MDKMRVKCSSTPLIEDQKVRVTRFEIEPDQETGWHEHGLDYVINAITDCNMTLENSDATISTTEIKAGNAYSRKAGVCHNVINSSEKK